MSALLALCALVAIWLLVARLVRRASRADPEAELLKLCHGDAAQRDRLIELERRRAPDLPRREAALRAIETRRRDNR